MILPPLTNGSWNSGPPLVRLPWLGRLGLLVRAASLAWIGHRVARVWHWVTGGWPGRSGFIAGRSDALGLAGMTNSLHSP
jgi:hypothetical protein